MARKNKKLQAASRSRAEVSWVWYGVLVLLRAWGAVGPWGWWSGYVHPDEFFQSPEVAAGAVLGHTRLATPWEFDPAYACRSIPLRCVARTRIRATSHAHAPSHTHASVVSPQGLMCVRHRLFVSGLPFAALEYLNRSLTPLVPGTATALPR
jgi:hypothetical protein